MAIIKGLKEEGLHGIINRDFFCFQVTDKDSNYKFCLICAVEKSFAK